MFKTQHAEIMVSIMVRKPCKPWFLVLNFMRKQKLTSTEMCYLFLYDRDRDKGRRQEEQSFLNRWNTFSLFLSIETKLCEIQYEQNQVTNGKGKYS